MRLLLVAMWALTACSAPAPIPEAPPPPPSCATPAECLYRPAATYEFTTTTRQGLTYTDVTGVLRNVNVAVYRPMGAPTPMPVVLLSHGGADGKVDPLKSMDDWAPVFAKAGYLAVAIAHEGRTAQSYDALCAAVQVQPDIQCALKIGWDRPHDVDRVLAFVKDEADRLGADVTHIAHVGHSAGAGAALMSGGVTRNFKCAQPFGVVDVDQRCDVADLVSFAKPDIDAVVSLSPQGPGSDGFMNESYASLGVPLLMATGAADGDPGEPANRLALWPLVPPGDRYKVWVDDPGAQHTLFEGSTAACERVQSAATCAALRNQLFATAIAFVDATLRGSADAKAWLASDRLTAPVSLERR